jgi:hypothetical protein
LYPACLMQNGVNVWGKCSSLWLGHFNWLVSSMDCSF